MSRILFYFLVLVLSVGLGIVIKHEPGYFLIMINHYSVEMPLWIGALLLVVSFAVFHYSINFFQFVFNINHRIYDWFERRRRQHSHSYTTRSLLALSEGCWRESEKYALKAIPNSDCQLVDYLVAARAAQHQGALDRRDRFLRHAKRSAPQEKIAVELTQAQLQIEAGQYEQAIALVKHLYGLMPKHEFILKLLHKLYLKIEDWQSLYDLLPVLYKSGLFSNAEYNQLEQQVHFELFKIATFETVDSVDDFWHRLPKAFKKQSQFLLIYVDWLHNLGADQTAETHLKTALKRSLDNDLVLYYGKVVGANPTAQFSLAEYWLNQQPKNPALLATAARLAVICEYWGKAKAFFKESLAIKYDLQLAAEYAALLENSGETDEALAYYKQALLQANSINQLRG